MHINERSHVALRQHQPLRKNMDRRNSFVHETFISVLHAHKIMATYLWQCKTARFFEENIEIDIASLFPNGIDALSNVLLISIFLALPTAIHILTHT